MIDLQITYDPITCRSIVHPKHNRGGLAEVVSHASVEFHTPVRERFSRRKLLDLLGEGYSILVLSPSGLFVCIITLMISSNIWRRAFPNFYFDHHPFAFQGSKTSKIVKSVAYILLPLLLLIMGRGKNLLIPDGPLTDMFPFKLGRVKNLITTDSDKFKVVNGDNTGSNVYYYIGTFSEEKLSYRIEELTKSKVVKLLGYKDGLEYINVDAESYSGPVQIPSKALLIWTSEFESYGLVIREWASVDLPIIFLCKPLKGFASKRSIYCIDNKFSRKTCRVVTCIDKYYYHNVVKKSYSISAFFNKKTIYHCLLFWRCLIRRR